MDASLDHSTSSQQCMLGTCKVWLGVRMVAVPAAVVRKPSGHVQNYVNVTV